MHWSIQVLVVAEYVGGLAEVKGEHDMAWPSRVELVINERDTNIWVNRYAERVKQSMDLGREEDSVLGGVNFG
jgi:hypothetical protein